MNEYYPVVVVGSGISGLFVALEAAKHGRVLVLTKGSIDDCNTRWAQGGIAAAIGPLDSVADHLRDTIAAGAGLVDEEAARILCSEAPARIRDLVDYGVAFDEAGGEVALAREAAHSAPRVLHAGGDRTGAAIENALTAAVARPTVTVKDYAIATRLSVERGRVTGVQGIDLTTGRAFFVAAGAVVLATGGAGQLYSHTTNPAVATGDGIALALAAGAEVMDLEFYQFHPTALRIPGAEPFLISEAVRGEGAILRNAAGEAFMSRYDPRAELAPRDIVARAIVAEMRRTGASHVFLDCTAIPGVDLAARFPGIYARCRAEGIDIRSELIPVAPAAHYLMGGVRTDIHGRTTVEGLYACGECACTGVHGANRLASNSLMETVVFGKRVVEHIVSATGGTCPASASALPLALGAGAAPRHMVQAAMWEGAGIERDADGLRAAMALLAREAVSGELGTREAIEDANLSTVAGAVLEAAFAREESRGAHYRSDFPDTDDRHWRRHLVYRRAS